MDEFISVQADNMIIQKQIQLLRLQQNNQNAIYIYIPLRIIMRTL